MDAKIFIGAFVDKMKFAQEKILEFIHKEEIQDADIQNLIKNFKDQRFLDDKLEFKSLINLISKISSNHHQTADFIHKIELILKNLQTNIQNFFSNYDIFIIFKSNKRVLLFLFTEKIIIPDKTISSFISKKKYKNRQYPEYFYPEFKSFYDEQLKSELISSHPVLSESDSDSFQQKRKIGQNDSKICELIRNDMIDEFIQYLNQNNFPVDYEIQQSIFETNSYLNSCFPTLIEYAAFFGSLKICKYLITNNAGLGSFIYMFAIHSENAELIHILEENQVEMSEFDYKESIKCHHIAISNYFKNKLNLNSVNQCLHYYNFIELDNQLNNLIDNIEFSLFYDLCKYDYITIVDFLLKNNSSINVNSKIISK